MIPGSVAGTLRVPSAAQGYGTRRLQHAECAYYHQGAKHVAPLRCTERDDDLASTASIRAVTTGIFVIGRRMPLDGMVSYWKLRYSGWFGLNGPLGTGVEFSRDRA